MQGSAWLGELRILREYSLDDAMTMKLAKLSAQVKGVNQDYLHVENTEGTEGTRIPSLHVIFHSRVHRIEQFTDKRDGPFVPR